MSLRVRPAAVVVLALLAVLTAVATPVAAAPSQASSVDAAATSNGSQSLDGRTTLAIQLRPDGDATWTVTQTFRLEDEGDREAFAQLSDEFERGRGNVLGLDAFRAAAENASVATGRAMTVRNVSRASEVANATGRLHLRFEWTAFARTNGSRMFIGDAFNTTNGTWLPQLGADQTLVIRPASGYTVNTASTGPNNDVLRWEGPQRFEPGDLEATYQQVQSPPGTGGNALLLAVLVLVGGGLLVAVAYILSQRDFPFGDDEDDDAVASNGGTAAAATAEDGGDDEEAVDEELLSDEERIERLLAANGGRMKQASIVKETGWSNAKVSQLLSAMAEEDRINKLRIGRENLITDPDEDVGDLES
jgi:hypothetical protein